MPRTLIGFVAAAVLATPSVAAAEAHASHGPQSDRSVMMQTPASIANEHHALHETLARAATEGGPVGVAAKELEAALGPHFKREEEIATPPLGLLPALSRGEITAKMKAVLPLTGALERELPQMLREHGAIRVAVAKLRSAAKAAGRPDYVRFSDELAAHARQEEEILYPAAILVGRYVAAKTARSR